MKPLFFLTGHTIVNSFRRAIQSPTRILGVLMIIGWWFMVVAGNTFQGGRKVSTPTGQTFALPPENTIFAVLFAAFLVLFLLRSFVMFTVPGVYRQADSDVLFAAPVKPWHVMAHKFLIDYTVSLLLPLFLLIFSGRRSIQGIENLIRNLPDPAAAQYFGRMALAAFLLLSLFLAALGYAVGMAINRDTNASRTARTWAKAIVFGIVVALFGVIANSVLKGSNILAHLVDVAAGPAVRACLFPITAAVDIAVAPLYGSLTNAIAPAAFLIVASAGCLWIAFRQSPHLFDMASRQAATSQVARDARRKGDQSWMLFKAAREGKLKPRRVRWIERLSPQGQWAIIWREAILTVRMNIFMFTMFLVMSVGVTSLMLLDREGNLLFAIVLVQFIMQLSISMGFAQTGFTETLRRLDLQKPLPFSAHAQCLMETIGKSFAPIVISILSGLAVCAMVPNDWQIGVAMAIGFPTTIIVVVATQLLVLLLFPDIEDPTQSAFRGLMQFLGSAIAAGPGLITAIGLSLVMPVTAAAAIATLVNIAVVAVLLALASPVYAAYNPSE